MTVSGLENIPASGAVLLAGFHPNSFLDAIVLASIVNRPVWSLARGDAFHKKWARMFFLRIKMLPIYRLSEGKEFLSENDDTFHKCLELFKKNEVVLIFSEGICTNQMTLLPLKKGTARLCKKASDDGIKLKIIPIALTYNSFRSFGKIINVTFGEPIGDPIQVVDNQVVINEGIFFKKFNEQLFPKIQALISYNFQQASFFQNPLFYVGLVFNFPCYFLCQILAKKYTKNTVFYDSVTFGAMVFLLPIYWVFIMMFITHFFK